MQPGGPVRPYPAKPLDGQIQRLKLRLQIQVLPKSNDIEGLFSIPLIGEAHRRKGTANLEIFMAWLYRSHIPVERKGVLYFTCSKDFYLPSRSFEEGGGGDRTL